MLRGLSFIILILMIFLPCLGWANGLGYAIGEPEVINRVIEAAPETLLAIEDLGKVEASYMGSKSIFDTNLGAEANYTRDEYESSSSFFGTRTDTTNWNIGLNKKLPIGTTTSLNWLNQRRKLYGVPSIQGQSIFPNFPTYESIVEFSVSQPMMKNFGGLNDRSSVTAARKAYSSADLDTKFRIALVAHRALSVYWRWAVSYLYMKSWSQAVADSQNFLNITLERKRLGTVEETDVLAARANLLGKRNGLLEARRLSLQLAKDLKIILGYPEDKRISPRDRDPRFIPGIDLDKDNAISLALSNRWDYLSQKEEVSRQNVIVVSTKNKRWPSLDLLATLSANGLKSSYSNTMGSVNNPYWTVGMNFSVPFENRAARSEYKRARHDKSKAVIRLKKKENDITNEINELIDRIRINLNVLKNARSEVQMQRDKLYMELDKYRIGRSNSEMIVLYQNDRLVSELTAFHAWNDYLQTILDLKLAENTLIDL